MKNNLITLLMALTPLFTTLGCVSSGEPKELLQVHTEIFKGSFESVWRATQQTLINYPMNINNMDTGTLQTLYISGRQRFQPPHVKKPLPNGYQYRIRVKVLKSKSNRRARITITKSVRERNDFFSEYKDIDTDGWEEKMLLYRIGREMRIERILKRAQKRMEAQDNE